MQCNAMQGERNARSKGRLLIREWNPALTAFATGMAASRTFLVSSELSVLLLLDVTSGTGKRMQDPACPFCPSCQPAFPTTPGSLGKCMQVLGAQSNLPTLLLSIRLVGSLSPGPHRIPSTSTLHRRKMTTPSHASRWTTKHHRQPAAVDGTSLLSCLECLYGTGELDIAAGPATSAPTSSQFPHLSTF